MVLAGLKTRDTAMRMQIKERWHKSQRYTGCRPAMRSVDRPSGGCLHTGNCRLTGCKWEWGSV